MSDLDRLMQLHHELGRVIRQHMLTSTTVQSVNMHQLYALAFIREREGVTMSEFAAFMQISPASATSLIKRLDTAKLIHRFHDKENRKLVRLRLTPKGSIFVEKQFAKKQQMFRSIFEILPSSDQRELARILGDLVSAYHARHHAA